MDSRYDHQQHEDRISAKWTETQAFNPDTYLATRTGAKSFSVIMPPPNANDPLHIGHAMFVALEDILVRFHRMLGDDAVWIPGTDHAGIETQFVFEKKLKKDGKSRFQFDRNTLYKMIWDYVQENSDVAVNQLKKLGASADWSRFRFTLDPQVVAFVLQTFEKLHQRELVYRQWRQVNYCTRCGTSYSDLEVNHTEQVTSLVYVKYFFIDKPDEFLTVATTRPETIFADTHLAIHPDNPKTKNYAGRQVLNPLTGETMSILEDSFVDPEFGTGVVKITPAHDATDWEVGQRHHLEIRLALDTTGKITALGGDKYAGLKLAAARQQIIDDLTASGHIDTEKTNSKYVNRVGVCYRCGTVIEKIPLAQFFIKVKPLVEPVQAALAAGKTTIHGAGHDKILDHWLANLKDWNISRQIVWGIRLPVWYHLSNPKNKSLTLTYIDREQNRATRSLEGVLEQDKQHPGELETALKNLQQLSAPIEAEYVVSVASPGDDYIQETDTFDTWFSSAQWPVVTLKTNKPGDFDRFYPTSVMETGYDILPFWVMRMLMMGVFLTNQVPFTDVYLHGLVRDQKGQKMSKSKGNVINPLAIIESYGADALRMALVIRSTAGLDKSVGEADFKAMRNFTNKLWNGARFVKNLAETAPASTSTLPQDEAFTQHLDEIITTVTQQLNDLKMGLAADTLYTEFWHWYCDECIESAKQGQLSPTVLVAGLDVFLKLLHPFAPFVTEAIWAELHPQTSELLVATPWPIAAQ